MPRTNWNCGICVALSVMLLTGCLAPGGAKPPRRFVAPPYESRFLEAIADAVPCASPLRKDAVKKLGPDFTYGCFCGKGHPPIPIDQNKLRLAEAYFGIIPLDEIDAACQMHDVCWILNGKEVWCDDAFNAQIERFQQELKPLIGFWEIETPEWRCANLARDIQMAANATFPSFSSDKLWGSTMVAFKILAAPISLLYTATTVANWDNYPTSPCDLSTLRSGAPTPAGERDADKP